MKYYRVDEWVLEFEKQEEMNAKSWKIVFMLIGFEIKEY